MSTDGWIYEYTADGTARFVLGTVGENPLVCFGINPSTAKPNALDRTVNRVAGFAASNGFDSWTMLNVYPQIATDPLDLEMTHRPDLKQRNEEHIATLLAGKQMTLLAAWGDLITTRPYLAPMLKDLVDITSASGCDWTSLGTLTVKNHPRHPLYVKGTAPIGPFDMDGYLQRLP